MGKIPVDGLIAIFQKMYEEHWAYVWGAAKQGCVDCSGAFVYAYNQYGRSITHGSNAIARSYVVKLLPVSDAQPGMAAFKLKKPGQSGYDLPDRYKNSPDQNDYYHIGLIDQTGQYVLNAQGEKAGFTRTPISKWGRVGLLKAVNYKGDETQMEQYIVTADNGLPVRVRDNPEGKVIARLNVGTKVEAGEPDAKGWQEVRFDGKTGYMMSKFLTKPGDTVTLTVDQYERLCQARDLLIAVLGVG